MKHASPGARIICIVGLLLAWFGTGPDAAWGAAESVVVLANRNVPASTSLARYYMERRNIPLSHLCLLDLPKGEVISRRDYEVKLRDPLLRHLRNMALIDQTPRSAETVKPHETAWLTQTSRVNYVVSMYGVPVRIADTRLRLVTRVTDRLGYPRFKDMAAVDSELALLLAPPYDLSGPLPNPLFGKSSYGRELGTSYALIATRLDGPEPEQVRATIDDALQAERYGLLGRVYIDTRGLREGPYMMGDYWLHEAQERLARFGYESVTDVNEPTWPTDFPMEDVAIYLGWYEPDVSGPFTRSDFRFQPGAVAYHLHSGSAARLRSPDRHWAGPLLHRGAAVTMGAVSEPFLQFTPQLHLFIDRLTRGYSFGEAAYLAQNTLSWQITFVGDPLYRPFRYSLRDQIAHLTEDNHPGIEWAHLRQINLLVREGRFNVALNYARAHIQAEDSLVLRERVADLYALNELYSDASTQYEYIVDHAPTAATAVRVGANWMRALEAMGKKERSAEVRRQVETAWPDSPMLPWLARKTNKTEAQ